jgi:hypothetical protein
LVIFALLCSAHDRHLTGDGSLSIQTSSACKLFVRKSASLLLQVGEQPTRKLRAVFLSLKFPRRFVQ